MAYLENHNLNTCYTIEIKLLRGKADRVFPGKTFLSTQSTSGIAANL